MIVGIGAWAWWKEGQIPKDSRLADTGEKTADGNPIIEVTGVGGTDDGVKVKGYELPENMGELVLPITVVVKPNKSLFSFFKVGENVEFTKKADDDELVWMGKIGEATGDYAIWYPTLRTQALGAI